MLTSSSGNASESLYTFWRSENETETDLVYIVNQGADDGPYSTFTFSFENAANSTPYILDTWTGQQRPLIMCNRTYDGYLTTTMRLKSQLSVIIGFQKGHKSGQMVSSASSNVENVYQEASGGLVALASDDKKATVTLEGGETKYLPEGPIPWTINLTSWRLIIDLYEPVETPGNGSTITATKIRPIDVGQLKMLEPWTQTGGLQNISGVGTYRTEFDWPQNQESIAGFLSFGQVLNTLRALVNGELVPPVVVADAYADVTDMIRPGTNKLVVEVSSTLFNAVKARRDGIHCLGESPANVSAFDGD